MSDSDHNIVFIDGICYKRLPKPDDLGRSKDSTSFWRLAWVDDYDGLTKTNESVYLPPEDYRPKIYDYSRHRLSQLAQMWVVQFAVKHPDLLKKSPASKQHERYVEWMNWLLETVKIKNPSIYRMSQEDRAIAIETERAVSDSGIKLSWEIYGHLPKLMNDTRSAIEVIIESGLLSHHYETQLVYEKFERLVDLLGLRDPSMEILEIGAGTGSATQHVLKSLSSDGIQKYRSYTFTDISPSFFEAAAAKFSQYPDMGYKVYNMERSPEEQELKPSSFDLVIASCVVHVTNIVNVLKSIRRLLKPEGRLLLLELTAEHHDINFTLVSTSSTSDLKILLANNRKLKGLFPGVFDGYEEGRKRHPFLTPEQWHQVLPQAVFTVPEVCVNDVPEEWFAFSVLTARAIESANIKPLEATHPLLMVSLDDHSTSLSRRVHFHAQQRGLIANYTSLESFSDADLMTCTRETTLIVLGELKPGLGNDSYDPMLSKLEEAVFECNSVLRVTRRGRKGRWQVPHNVVDESLVFRADRPECRMVSIDFDPLDAKDNDIIAQEVL